MLVQLPAVESLMHSYCSFCYVSGHQCAYKLCVLHPEIPVFPTVTAKVTFQEFEWKEAVESHLFVIPSNYREDPRHFRDL